jgi:hypothetical protein
MSEWIKHLASRIKEVDHEAAEKLHADARRKGILDAKGPVFYKETVTAIQRDLKLMEEDLKEDVTGFPTTVSTPNAVLATIGRQACPFVTATFQLMMPQEQIVLSGSTGNPVKGIAVRQHGLTFRFEIGENDGVFVAEPFGEQSKKFHHPNQLAEHIVKLLFSVDPA